MQVEKNDDSMNDLRNLADLKLPQKRFFFFFEDPVKEIDFKFEAYSTGRDSWLNIPMPTIEPRNRDFEFVGQESWWGLTSYLLNRVRMIIPVSGCAPSKFGTEHQSYGVFCGSRCIQKQKALTES